MPKFLLYSCLCCAHGCVYTCTVHTDFHCTVIFPLWPIGASHPSRGHHTHTHHTHRVKCWARVPRLKNTPSTAPRLYPRPSNEFKILEPYEPYYIDGKCFYVISIFWGQIRTSQIFSRGTRAQHLTLCGVCVVSVWCPLDGCDALISQQDNCTVTVSVYSVCVHTTQPWAQHSPE